MTDCDRGGDPPCWAERVCDACGALVADDNHRCGEVRPVTRTITGFRQDDVGDWVAELSCLHSQHVRHHPPFRLRPWVLTDEGRSARLGTEIDCPACARAELPDGLGVARTAGPFDQATLPAGLLRDHRVAEGTWGCLHVAAGEVIFSMQTEPPTTVRLAAGGRKAIPPGILHALTVVGPVRLTVDFLVPVTGSSRSSDTLPGRMEADGGAL